MNILITQTETLDGCTWYRIINLASEAKRQKLVDYKFLSTSLDDDEMDKIISDADIFLMRLNDKSLQILKDLREFQPGKRIILDIDDAYDNIDPLSNMYASMGTQEVQLTDGRWLWKDGERGFNLQENLDRKTDYEEVMRSVDGIIVTTFELKTYAEEFNENVVIIPNAINFDLFPRIEVNKGNTLRLVWAGGSSHYSDLVELNSTLQILMKRYPNLEYWHVGQLFPGILKNLPESRVFTSPWLKPDGHGFRMATIGADIGVCPLQDIIFNTRKSSVKFYEYAATGIATIAKNIPPYTDDIVHDKTGLLYNTAEELSTYIEQLINDPIKRITLAQNAYEYVNKYRNIKTIAKEWVEYLQGMMEA